MISVLFAKIRSSDKGKELNKRTNKGWQSCLGLLSKTIIYQNETSLCVVIYEIVNELE